MIVWLTGAEGYSSNARSVVLNALRTDNISPAQVLFYSLHVKAPGISDYTKKKMAGKSHLNAARHALQEVIRTLKPACVVINDEASLRAITERPYSLNQVRGSVYYFEKTPCIVLDNIDNLYAMQTGKFVFGLDFAKIIRFAKGNQARYPDFELFVVKAIPELEKFVAAAEQAVMIATDTETYNQFITCMCATFDYGNRLITIVVPFFNPYAPGGNYWSTEFEEARARYLCAKLLSFKAAKAMQNGMYDCAYFVESAMPPLNYYLDCSYMMHSLWIEAPKRLHHIASYFLDNYVYWKDENKGEKEESFGSDPSFMAQYWRYNGLDGYYTYLSAMELLKRLVQFPWAVGNYRTRIRLAAGPCLAASLRGVKIDQDRHAQIMDKNQKAAAVGEKDLQELTGEPGFNPGSTQDVAWWLYDVLGASKTRLQRKGSKYSERSTDEKVLKLVKEQRNPVINNFIDRLLRAKKPASVISKFGNLYRLGRRKRFVSWQNPAGTISGRFNSTKSQFWVGTNGQNIQKPLREMFVADPDYVLVDIDFSASDDWFVSYESEDPAKIETVNGKRDSHCLHCSIFFSKTYEEIERGWLADEDWCVAEPQGLRQITKKITHGRNYLEGPDTMYNLMGRDAVVATAVALGHRDAAAWDDKRLIAICAELGEKYDNPRTGMYRRLRKWQEEIVLLAAKTGGLVQVAFGMTMKLFGNVLKDDAIHRKIASLYGQGGTAGNVNRSIDEIYYSGVDDGRNCLYLLQVHDSAVFAVHRTRLDLVGKMVEIMEKPVTIHGRTFRVPAQAKVGLTWAKKMLAWTKDTTYEQIVEFERKTFASKYPVKTLEEKLEIAANRIVGNDIDVGAYELPDGLSDPEEVELELDQVGLIEETVE